MAELLKNVAEEWQMTKKDLVLVTDNASNMAVAAEQCNFLQVKCYSMPTRLTWPLSGRSSCPLYQGY